MRYFEIEEFPEEKIIPFAVSSIRWTKGYRTMKHERKCRIQRKNFYRKQTRIIFSSGFTFFRRPEVKIHLTSGRTLEIVCKSNAQAEKLWEMLHERLRKLL